MDLLPYHPMGEAKSVRVGMAQALHDISTPSIGELEAMAARFRNRGLNTTIGGRP